MRDTPDVNGLLDLVQRQASASSTLTHCTNFREMAGAIAEHMLLDAGQFITINPLEYIEGEDLFLLHTIATANRHAAYDTNEIVEMKRGDLGKALSQVLNEATPVLIERVEEQDDFSPAFKSWLKKHKVRALAAWPMRHGNRTFGVVCLNSLSGDLKPDQMTMQVYQVLADQVSVLVQLHRLTNEFAYASSINEGQRRVFDELTPQMTFEEMAGVVARHLLTEQGRFVSLIEFVHNENGLLIGWRTLATANRKKTFTWGDAVINLNWETIDPSLRDSIVEHKPFMIENMEGITSSFAGEDFYQFFTAAGIKALLIVPIAIVEGRMILGLGMMSRFPATYNQEEVNVLSNVAEQIGALARAHLLIEQTQSAQNQAIRLAETNREIAAAENYEILAKTLMRIVPEAVTDLAVALFDKPVIAGERPLTLESKVIVSRTGATHLQVVDQIPMHPDVVSTLQRLLVGDIIIMSKTSSPVLPPITESLLQAQGVSALAIMGLRIGPRLLGLLMLGSSSRLTLTALEQDNFRAIADQVAVSIENRSLLDQTADTLSFVQSQFEATSAVYDAKYPLETLEAFYRFIGGQFKHTHLGLLDRNNANSVHIIAEIHHSQTSAEERQVEFSSYPAYEALPALETLYVPDVTNDSFLTEAERTRLQGQDISSLIIVPLVANQRMVGLITFMSPIPATVPPNRLRALRNLADQAAIVFDNRTLLASTAETLDETRLLYEVNRSVLAAQDTFDVLRTLREYLAPDASMINHMTVLYDLLGQIQDVKVDFINLPNGEEQAVDLSLTTIVGTRKMAALQSFWSGVSQAVSFVPDIRETSGSHPLFEMVVANGNRATVSILIRDSNRVRESVTIAFSEPQQFDRRQQRLYEAVSDQIAIVFQNHHLLREAQVSAAQLSRQVQTLQTINQFSTVINAISEEKTLLATGAELMVELLGIDHCGIVMITQDKATGEVVSEYPAHGSLGAKVATLNSPVWGELQNQGESKPLVILDVQRDSRIEPLTRKAFNDLGIHSMAILPIVVHNQLIGGVGLDIYDPNRSITPQMVEVGQIITAQINLALQNVRLLKDIQASAQQLEGQVHVLQALNEMAADINATLNQQELLNNTTEVLPDLLNVDHCGVVLLDDDKVTGRIVSEYPSSGAVGNTINIESGNPLYTFIKTQDFYPIVTDVEKDRDLGESTRSVLRKMGVKTLVMVPLVISGEVIGSLGLDIFSEGHTFTAETISVAQTVASQLAIGLQNVRLLTEARRRAEQLQRIASFSQSVQATFDTTSIFETVFNETAKMLPVDQMAIMFYDSVRQELRTIAQRVDGKNQVRMAEGELVPISGPVAQVWSTRETLHIPDLRKLGQGFNPSITVRSWIMTPILSRGRVTGMVSIGSNRPYAYAETDVALFSQMINQLAAAIENAEAYQQSQRVARNEALVNDISTQLQRQMDIRSMLDITASELGKKLGARKARIRLATHVPENGEAE